MVDTTYSAYRGGGSWQDDGEGKEYGGVEGKGYKGKKRKSLPYVKGVKFGKEAPKGCVFGCEWGKDRRDPDGKVGNLGKKV